MTRPTNARPAEGLDPSYERELVRQAAATRRSIVLGALTLILLVTLVLAIVSIVPRWAPILAAVPVVAFVLATSMTASARSSRAAVRPARTSARDASAPATRAAAAPAAQADDDWETWNAWDDEDSWEPVPQTLPTYVTAPRASAVPRGIDRSRPGEWTGSAMVETAQAMRSRPRSAPLADPSEIDHGAEHRRDPGRGRVVGPASRGQRVGVSRPHAASCYPFLRTTRGCSAAGSAPRSQRGGQGFESPQLHHLRRGRRHRRRPLRMPGLVSLRGALPAADSSTPTPLRRSRDGRRRRVRGRSAPRSRGSRPAHRTRGPDRGHGAAGLSRGQGRHPRRRSRRGCSPDHRTPGSTSR